MKPRVYGVARTGYSVIGRWAVVELVAWHTDKNWMFVELCLTKRLARRGARRRVLRDCRYAHAERVTA